jgi:hypothetical protein
MCGGRFCIGAGICLSNSIFYATYNWSDDIHLYTTEVHSVLNHKQLLFMLPLIPSFHIVMCRVVRAT